MLHMGQFWSMSNLWFAIMVLRFYKLEIRNVSYLASRYFEIFLNINWWLTFIRAINGKEK